MLLPIKWLKDYIKTEKNSRELADKLTLSGSHVESIIPLNKGIENVQVGQITQINKHPDADKLLLISVDIGSEELQIVTGATNISEGDFVPVATVGAKLPGDITIEKTDFRGIDSYGMLCSLNELGYSDNVISKEMKEGILILDKEYSLGTDIVSVLGLDNEVIELEITPNRPDCLSIVGMAREAGAALNVTIEEPKININNAVDTIEDYMDSIEVESSMCKRYYGRVVKDVTIKESPLWMQIRLMEAGVRPINNIVDITNFVMLEYGQPLHAFDLDKIDEGKIVVRQAKTNETFTTLDNIKRKLDNKDLVITDGKKPIAIAGVMGGIDSEVTENTKIILLEGANFNEGSIRKTSKKLGLRTEASNRFEKGIDPNLCKIAVDRACQLIEELQVGTIVNNNIDVYKNVRNETDINLRPERVNMLLGIDIDTNDMLGYLNRLGLKSTFDGQEIKTTCPTYRLDLESEVDLIEEIGRLYGFHNIESKPLVGVLTRGERPYENIIMDKSNFVLMALGFNEVMTYSFISPKSYDKINITQDSSLRNYIKLLNPLGEDYSIMRTTLIPEMLELMSRNYNRGIKSSFVYEIGSIFIPKELPIEQLPEEKKVLSIGFYGEEDFYFLKETIEKLLNKLGIKNIEYTRETNNPTFHPGRTAKIFVEGVELGFFGEVHVDVLENYEISDRIYLGHLYFDLIVELANLDIKYKPLPKYPSMTRDIALVVKEDVMVGQIENIILKHGEDLIEKIELFDIYTGGQIPEGMKSVAYSITYRSYERTLRENQINKIQESIIKDLEESLGGKLRS